MMRRALALLALLVLAGCSGKDEELRPYAVVRRADVWQAVIKDQDRGRLARLSEAWDQARADVAEAGAAAEMAALGPVTGDAITTNPALPTAGDHQCRTIQLGWRQGSPRVSPAVQASAWAPCRLSADGIVLRLAGEMGRLRYGEDGERDQLGVLQAVGPGHWRVALPWPRWTARLVLIELRAA
jgi:hypothetical protein